MGLRDQAEKALREQEEAQRRAELERLETLKEQIIREQLPEAIAAVRSVLGGEVERYGFGSFYRQLILKIVVDRVVLDYLDGKIGYIVAGWGNEEYFERITDLIGFARVSRKQGRSEEWKRYQIVGLWD